MGKTFKLGKPELGPEVERQLREGSVSARMMRRLMAVRMGLEGEHTLEQIAKAVGRSRSRIIEWMRIVREEGLPELLGRHQGRGRKAQVQGKALAGLRQGLRRGRWKTAHQATQWLEARHGVVLSDSGMRYWLKKAQES